MSTFFFRDEEKRRLLAKSSQQRGISTPGYAGVQALFTGKKRFARLLSRGMLSFWKSWFLDPLELDIMYYLYYSK